MKLICVFVFVHVYCWLSYAKRLYQKVTAPNYKETMESKMAETLKGSHVYATFVS